MAKGYNGVDWTNYQPVRDHKISKTRYIGKVCDKHPELKGERKICNHVCPRCKSAAQILKRKLEGAK